ncbi:hypothetical protein B7494_g3705 [Chlorociboria aeruginascens]|nr:hypothetical protein B7494_g3705 [Chlorociboria aeruginascens]
MSVAPVLTAQGINHLLQTVQRLGLYQCPFEELNHEAVVGEGESFRVERCRYNNEVVAVKHVKLKGSQSNSQSAYDRMQSVLLEIQIMRHDPLKEHPNILSALGYGWKSQGDSLLPYIVVEYATHGSLRTWLQATCRHIKTKFKIAGDVASGLMALHMCNIIHGDLKLDNIVVVPFQDRVIKVIAKLCDFSHSIILKEGSRDFKYFGTVLYNAPEVELQDTFKIAREALCKCDIWAFGLSIWEIFADGSRYFNPSWSNDSNFTSQASLNPPRYSEYFQQSSSLTSTLLNSLSKTSYVMVSTNNELSIPASDSGTQSGFGTFDPKHLQKLSREFVDTLQFTGLTIEKGYLKKLLSNTLQPDPTLRPSQIILLPTMVDWDRSDTGALQGELSMHTGSSVLNFQMFYPDQEYEIPWEYKRQILQNLISLSSNQKSQDEAASCAFQASICYMMGFGASPSPTSALVFLQKATELKHPMAVLFARNLEQALRDEAPERENSYTEDIIQGFKNQSPEIRGFELRNISSVLGPTVESFKSFADFQFWLKGVDENDYERMTTSYVITMPFMIRMDILSLAIAMDDVSTVRKFAKVFLQKTPTSSDEPAVIQACRRGNTEIVQALLSAGADPEALTDSGCSLYHWLFMLGDGARSIAEQLRSPEPKIPSTSINHPCSQPYILHPQWPLKLIGTPLAFAVLSKSAAAVKILLDLGALPYTPVNGLKDSTSKVSWTPIHLAVKFHLVDIFHLLLDAMDGTVEVITCELARSISYSTMVERLAMHSKDIVPALAGTLAEFPSMTLSTASNDGLTPFMEAIDFSNLSVVRSMLQHTPELALERFVDPEDSTLFTYPAVFAAQIAARRDSSLALDIVKLLLSHMPRNYLVKDSNGRTPLHLSVTGYSTSATEWLLENHYSPDLPDSNGRTAVHQTRTKASLDILLSAGADIDHADNLGFTCIHLAALQGFEDLVNGLIYHNANMKCVSNIGSPLHCAVLKPSWRVASSLLKAKDKHGKPRVDINAIDANGDTAMHLAVKNSNRTDIVRLLFSFGVNANIQNKDGLTPFHLLVSSGDLESIEAFILAEKVVRESRNSEILKRHSSPTFVSGTWCGASSVVDFEMPTFDRRTPFHTAATFASVEIANTLLAGGVNARIRDMRGNTAVHFAILATDESIAKKKGDRYRFLDIFSARDLAAENKQGIRPWDLAFQQQNFDLMIYLLQKGGVEACKYKTLLTHHDGRKILHDAIDANEWTLVRLLLSPVNRCHLSKREIEAHSNLLKVVGGGDEMSIKDHIEDIFERWLGLFTQDSFFNEPIQSQLEALVSEQYSLKQIYSLCMMVNAAADYRALGALSTRTKPINALKHINNSRFRGRIWVSVSRLDNPNHFWLKQFATDLEELELEALQEWERVLWAAQLSDIPGMKSQITSLFCECDLSCLLHLAELTSVLLPDRPVNETEEWCVTANPELIPELRKAISNKDGTNLKEKFPVDSNVVIKCCSCHLNLHHKLKHFLQTLPLKMSLTEPQLDRLGDYLGMRNHPLMPGWILNAISSDPVLGIRGTYAYFRAQFTSRDETWEEIEMVEMGTMVMQREQLGTIISYDGMAAEMRNKFGNRYREYTHANVRAIAVCKFAIITGSSWLPKEVEELYQQFACRHSRGKMCRARTAEAREAIASGALRDDRWDNADLSERFQAVADFVNPIFEQLANDVAWGGLRPRRIATEWNIRLMLDGRDGWDQRQVDNLGDFFNLVPFYYSWEDLEWVSRGMHLRDPSNSALYALAPIEFRILTFSNGPVWSHEEMNHMIWHVQKRESLQTTYGEIAQEMAQQFGRRYRIYTYDDVRMIMVRYFAVITKSTWSSAEYDMVASRFPDPATTITDESHWSRVADELNASEENTEVVDLMWGTETRRRRRFTEWNLRMVVTIRDHMHQQQRRNAIVG